MRILTISNLYPPYFIGGYELGCLDVMQRLAERGHDVTVLTSTWQVNEACVEDDGAIKVHRQLQHFIGHERASTKQLQRLNPHNRTVLLRLVREFKPDIIYLWNMAGLPPRLNFDVQQTGLPVCYYVSDLWLSRWQNEQEGLDLKWRNRKAIARSLVWHYSGLQPHPRGLKLRCVQCTSDFIKQATLQSGLKNSADVDAIYQVIHWGVEPQRFPDATTLRKEQSKQNQIEKTPRRLIYAGQLAPHKGVTTAIEAVQYLKQDGYQVHLTIAGPSTHGNHGDELRERVQSLDLQEEIEFLGPVRREKLPELLASQEIFIFPAIWDEPFSIGLLEAMAAGLAVVGTTTGGSAEIVRPEENALAFPAGDAQACAMQIKRLLDDAALLEKISVHARRLVCENFTMKKMVRRIEESLLAVVTTGGSRISAKVGST